MHNATFSFTGAALEFEFDTIMGHIFEVEQYVHNEIVHFRTSSTINVFASWAFLNNFTNINSKYGSIAFFNA